MIRIRSGRGVGDSLYLRAMADHIAATAQEPVVALSDHPDIFIGSRARVEPFQRKMPCRVGHYTSTMADQSITQWQAILRSAGLPPDVPMSFAWSVRNDALLERVRRLAEGRPLLLVHGGREPMNRSDGFGLDLVPRQEAFERVLAEFADCFRVRIGKATAIYPLPCEFDLNGSTSIADLLDLASACSAVIAQCSFAVPLAECFGKPLLALWSKRGLKSKTMYLRHVTPQKVLERLGTTTSVVMDDGPDLNTVQQFRQRINLTKHEDACRIAL